MNPCIGTAKACHVFAWVYVICQSTCQKLLCNIAAIALTKQQYCSVATNWCMQVAHFAQLGHGASMLQWLANSHEADGMADLQHRHTLASFDEVSDTHQLFAWLIFAPSSLAFLWSVLAQLALQNQHLLLSIEMIELRSACTAGNASTAAGPAARLREQRGCFEVCTLRPLQVLSNATTCCQIRRPLSSNSVGSFCLFAVLCCAM